MFGKSLLAAVAALALVVGFAPSAQAFHFHKKVVCHLHVHRGHVHEVCKVVLVPVFGHHHHHGHHHHGHGHGHHRHH